MQLKRLSICIILFQGLCATAQSPWVESSYREKYYPSSTYYVSYHHLQNEGNLDECLSKAILGAQSMLANSIYSEVSSITTSSVNAINQDGNYSETESFINEFSSAASAKLVNVNIEHCYDKATRTIHAMAYVKKQDLSDFCESKLNTGIVSLNNKLSTISEFLSKGYKTEAKSLVGDALKEIQVYPSFLSQLITVGLAQTDPIVYSSKLENISKQLLKYNSDLEHSLSFYIQANNSSAIINGEILSGKCKGLLSENGCSFVDNSDLADYTITLDYTTRTSSKTDLGYFAFADVNLIINRTRDRCVIYDDLVSVKGGGGTEEKAHRKAIDLSTKSICDKILKSIK